MRRTNSNRTIREVAKAISNVKTPRSKTNEERALTISKRIAHNKPSTYNGKGEPSLLENWLREFDKLFSVVQCPDMFKVDQAAYFLIEDPDYWLVHSKHTLEGEAEEGFGWEELKKAIKEQFYPAHVRNDNSNEFARFEMGKLSVDEYY